MSFPGGHLEPGEDAVGAALRETREEIGDSLGEIEVLGTCQTLPAGRCGTLASLRSPLTAVMDNQAMWDHKYGFFGGGFSPYIQDVH